MKSLRLFLVGLLFIPALAQAKVFDAKSFTLDNGLQVVVVENHRAPILTSMIWYKVGGADEPEGMSGLAHMFEHMMFKGSENVAPGEFSEKVRAVGGKDNAFTSYDYTAYYQSVPAQHLEQMLEMEADRMTRLSLPPDEFKSELKVVMEERRQRSENDPRGAFYEQMDYSLYPHHPYGIPLIGWMSEIKDLTRDQAKDFYETWYAPNNAILIVSGDITVDELRPLAEKYFGGFEANPALEGPRERPELADFQGDYTISYTHPRIRQPVWSAKRRVPPMRKDRETGLALSILQEVLSGGPTTRLYTALVKEQQLASNAGLRVNNDRYGPGAITFYAVPRENVDMKAIEQAYHAELQKIIDNGVPEEELRDTKDRMQASAIYARDSVTGPAMIIGRALTSGMTLEEVENWPDDLEAITAEQVQEAAATYLDKEPYDGIEVEGRLLPEEAEKPQTQEEGEEAQNDE